MAWHDQLSQSEKDEMYLDACAAYKAGLIDELDLRKCLASLGYTATEIEDIERQHRP